MKYLKRFESIFGGASEPELFFDRNLPRSEKNNASMYNNYTQNREAWTKNEMDYLYSPNVLWISPRKLYVSEEFGLIIKA